jgi:hypothetical protein
MKRLGPHQVNQSGVTFPIDGLFTGMLFFRTDLSKLYAYNGATFDEIGGGGTAATFEWETQRVAGDFTTETAVPFLSSFTSYPIVTHTSQINAATAGSGGSVRRVSKTGFRLTTAGGTTAAISYFACTPGVWLVNDFLVWAFSAQMTLAATGWMAPWPRPFNRTPAVFASNKKTSEADLGDGSVTLHAGFQDDLADLDAGQHTEFEPNAGQTPFQAILIEPTGAAQSGNAITSAGTGSWKAGHKIECGLFRNGAANASTITFFSAFGAVPVGMLGAGNATGGAVMHRNITATPLVGSMTIEITAGGTSNFITWMAMTSGHNSVTARRLI